MPGIVQRDALVGNLLEKVEELERRIRYLEDHHPGRPGEAAGTLANYRADGGLHGPEDVYPDGEEEWGIFARAVNRLGITTYTDHFRGGTIPDGFSWISDGTFNGTPTNLDYSYRGTYLRVAANNTPHFLADAISTYADKGFWARIDIGQTTEFGVRIDDGTDDNYAEIILDPNDAGAYTLDFRYRAGGGAVTDNAGPTYPCTVMVLVLLLWSSATPAVLGYTRRESGDWVHISSFSTGAVAWTPSRVGFVVRINGGNYGNCDWFYSTFE